MHQQETSPCATKSYTHQSWTANLRLQEWNSAQVNRSGWRWPRPGREHGHVRAYLWAFVFMSIYVCTIYCEDCWMISLKCSYPSHFFMHLPEVLIVYNLKFSIVMISSCKWGFWYLLMWSCSKNFFNASVPSKQFCIYGSMMLWPEFRQWN